MRRDVPLAVALLLLLLPVACDDGDPPPEPTPEGGGEPAEEDRPVQGLRVGLVLPPADTAVADEIDPRTLGLDELDDRFEHELAELRTTVPDGADFVADLATLLAVDGYDVVCVIGPSAADVVLELAQRHGATEFCAAPAAPTDDAPDNVRLVDVAMEELGHVVGVATRALADEEPVAVLGPGTRAGDDAFRSGLRAGAGDTPVREARGDESELATELDAAVRDEVAAIVLDAGLGARDLTQRAAGVPLLGPMPLLGDEDADGALRWRVRWDLVVETVISWYLDANADPPERLGMREQAFRIDHGPRSTDRMRDAVEQAMGELERGERDPLASPEAEEADPGDDEDDEDDEDAAAVGAEAAADGHRSSRRAAP